MQTSAGKTTCDGYVSSAIDFDGFMQSFDFDDTFMFEQSSSIVYVYVPFAVSAP